MLSLICAPSGYGKTARIVSEIKNIIALGEGRKIYVIVPEQESVKVEALLLEKIGNVINRDVEVLNFSRLANRVFREAGGMTYKYVDNCGKDLITAVLLEKGKKELPSFSSMADDVNYLRLIRSEMDLLRQKGIHPSHLEKARLSLMDSDKGGESLWNKLSDFSLVFSLYEKALGDGNVDSTDDTVRLAKTLSEYDFFESSYVFIDGFYDYTVPQYSVIEEIIKGAFKTTVTFSLSLTDPDGIFRKTRLAYDKIRELAERCSVEYEKVELKENHRTGNPALLHLAEAFINGNSEKYEKKYEGVSLTSASTPYDECVYVAREITKLVKSGTALSDIAVTSARISDYGSMLESVFDSYGIKYLSCTETSPITEPIVSLVLLALDTVNSGYFYKNIKTYLKNPYLNLSETEAFALENYVTLWHTKGKAWVSEEDFTLHPRGYVEDFSDADKDELETVNNARKKIYTPLKLLFEGISRPTVEEKVRAIVEYLDVVDAYNSINRDSEEERGAWNLLIQALEEIVQSAGDLKVSKEKFVKYLRLVLGDMSFGKIPSSLDEVELGDVGFVRNKNIKHLFFLGFNEGVFPSVSETKSVFTENERRWLAASDIVLDDSIEDKMYDQSFLFLIALLTPSETLSFVYHNSSSDSAKAVSIPSSFFSHVKECLDLEPQRFVSSEALPVSENELEEYFLVSNAPNASRYLDENYKEFGKSVAEIKSFIESKDKLFSIENPSDFIKNNYAMTQSRLEKFERCRFSYFVEYMLKARTRKPARFSNAEIGSYVHKILELVLKKITSEGKTIETVTKDEILTLTEEVAEEYVKKVTPDIASDSPKYKYLIDNVCAFVVFVIENIKEEFSVSRFKPTLFEENLADSENVKPYEVRLSDGGTLTFYGVIDRVDTFVDENGLEYIRVVDYKTKSGGKTFSLEDVINGMNIQMLIYLFAMTSTEGKPNRRAAGIMYMPAAKTELKATDSVENDETVGDIIIKGLKRSGMYLDDRRIIDAMEEGENKRFVDLKYDKKSDTYTGNASSTLIQLEAFGLIERYINSLFDSVMSTLKSGDISPEPLEEGSGRTSCDWCSFKSICRYDGQCKKRIKEKKPLEYMKNVLGE